ncbi:MAG: stage 0 sporulation family protein [Clostridia bacterium]
MTTVVGIRFRQSSKIYSFAPGATELHINDLVVVETVRGIEMGTIATEIQEVEDDQLIAPLKQIMRKATEEDLRKAEDSKKKEKDAFAICEKKIEEHKIAMKLIGVDTAFDMSKLLFYFTADGRVDFRELVKDLAGTFRTRIELRQIGVRDEAKLLGGIGICGRAFCCTTFLNDFQTVSIKMAKDQSMSLNPLKISGVCGRLMCCLKYEHEVYTDLIKKTPGIGAIVETADGKGEVIDVSLLKGELRVRLDKGEEVDIRTYNVADVTVLKKSNRYKMLPPEENEVTEKELTKLEDD